jgi:hypothetical protein
MACNDSWASKINKTGLQKAYLANLRKRIGKNKLPKFLKRNLVKQSDIFLRQL